MRLPFSDLPAFRRDPLKLLLDRAASAPPGFVPLYLAPRPIWFATEPAIARQVLKWPSEEVDKGRLVQTLKPIMGNSLLTNVGAAHNRTKSAVHRHVQRSAAAKYLDGMVAVVNSYASRFAMERELDTAALTAPLALELGCIALFGHEIITAADRLALIKAVQIVEAELAAEMFRVFPRMPWTARERARRLEHARRIVSLVVARARAGKERSDIIAALEDAGLSEDEIGAEILGLLIAGHHTTGATIAWLLYHLAIDPMIADMIALEADTVLSAIEKGDAAALRQAPLSMAYVREILRIYPPGWWTSREVFKPTTIGPRSFREGDMIMVSPWQLHRDPRFWDEPATLKLDRSSTEEAYMPFGVGPRSCIGQSIAWFELQLVTLQLASAFRLSLADGQEPAKPRPSVTLLAPPIRLIATPRTETAFRKQAA